MKLWLRVLVTVLYLGGIGPVGAQEEAPGIVAVGGEFLMRIRTRGSDPSVEARVDRINERLVPILSIQDLKEEDVRIEPFGKTRYRITVRKRFLVDVFPEDGRANGVSTKQQAEIWAKRLRYILPRVNYQFNPNIQGG